MVSQTVECPARVQTARAARLGSRLRGAIGRQIVVLVALGGLALLLSDRLAALDVARIGAAFSRIALSHWLMATLFTTMSFWAVGRYDAVVHRLLGTGITPRAAIASGASAIALSQTLGLGTVTGTLARWRLLNGVSLGQAVRISVFVSMSFLAAWSVLAGLACLAVPLPLPGKGWVVALGLTVTIGAALLSLIQPPWIARRMPVPPLRAMGVILALALLDTLTAGTALWLLLPPGLAVDAPEVLAAYLMALGAGLVLTTPGGLGPFEAALVALLPEAEPEPLLAGVLAFRAVYYAAPAVLGALVILRGPLRSGRAVRTNQSLRPPGPAPVRPFLLDAALEQAPRAEAGLLRHGRLSVLGDTERRPLALAAVSGQSLLVLGDPLMPGVAADSLLEQALAQARRDLRAPVLYKASPRIAVAARRRGWAVVPVAREALIAPHDFTTEGPARRQLRRKLRKAEAAGIVVTAATPDDPLPLREMSAIAADWSCARGGERGFSMGAWAPEALDWARIYLARDGAGRLAGFITVHANAREHTLDLMRAATNAPDGTMHRLVCAAISGAREAGVGRFSLAAVPLPATPGEAAVLGWVRRLFWTRTGAAGLQQFKAAFGPRWTPLYMAAPSRPAVVLGALDLLREIRRGAPRPAS